MATKKHSFPVFLEKKLLEQGFKFIVTFTQFGEGTEVIRMQNELFSDRSKAEKRYSSLRFFVYDDMCSNSNKVMFSNDEYIGEHGKVTEIYDGEITTRIQLLHIVSPHKHNLNLNTYIQPKNSHDAD